jgi:hypothetical protein
MGQILSCKPDNYAATQEITHLYGNQKLITLIITAHHGFLNKPDLRNFCPLMHSIPLNPF